MTDAPFGFDEEAYYRNLHAKLLNDIIAFNDDGTGMGGVVDPEIIREVLMHVMAAIDFNCGVIKAPRDRKRVIEEMGRHYSGRLNALQADPVLGKAWTPAQRLDPDGSKH